jgi:hypothetical protein
LDVLCDLSRTRSERRRYLELLLVDQRDERVQAHPVELPRYGPPRETKPEASDRSARTVNQALQHSREEDHVSPFAGIGFEHVISGFG